MYCKTASRRVEAGTSIALRDLSGNRNLKGPKTANPDVELEGSNRYSEGRVRKRRNQTWNWKVQTVILKDAGTAGS